MSDPNRKPHHVHQDGILQVDPERMQDVEQHVSVWDQRRIIANRWDYLAWMQHHFAVKVVPPHQKEQGHQ